MKFLKSILYLVLCLSNAFGQTIEINGSISFYEFTDNIQFRRHESPADNILIKGNVEAIYIGIHNTAMGTVNLILGNENKFTVLHISACSGRAIYERTAQDSLRLVKAILNVQEHPDAWDFLGSFATHQVLNLFIDPHQIELNRDSCYTKHGYKASTFDEGSYLDFEILFNKRVFGSSKLFIQNVELDYSGGSAKAQRKFHPGAGYEGDVGLMSRFLLAKPGTVLKLKLKTDKWIDLTKL